MKRQSASTGKAASGRRRTTVPRSDALCQSDQELDAVLDTIDYGILFMGPDLRAKIINRAFRQMWGISDEFIQTKRPTMGDLINYNRHNNLYDVLAVEFDDYVARRVEAVRSGTRSISE